MPLSADELASALLNRELTPARLLKLRRHLAVKPASNPIIDGAKVEALLTAIEAHPNGGANARAFVHEAIVNQPRREIPPLPDDITPKVEAFHRERADRAREKATR